MRCLGDKYRRSLEWFHIIVTRHSISSPVKIPPLYFSEPMPKKVSWLMKKNLIQLKRTRRRTFSTRMLIATIHCWSDSKVRRGIIGMDPAIKNFTKRYLLEILDKMKKGAYFVLIRSLSSEFDLIYSSCPKIVSVLKRAKNLNDYIISESIVHNLNYYIQYLKDLTIQYASLTREKLNISGYYDASFASNRALISQLGFIFLL